MGGGVVISRSGQQEKIFSKHSNNTDEKMKLDLVAAGQDLL